MASPIPISTWRSRVRCARFKINPTVKLEIESSAEQIGIQQLSTIANNSETSIETLQNGHVNVDIQLETMISNAPYTVKVPKLLRKYFSLMYNFGVFPYNYDGKVIACPKHILHQVLFWSFSTLCIIDAMRLVKFFSIGYISRGNLYRYTVMSYTILKAFIRLNFLYVLVQNRAKIVKVQRVIESMANSLENKIILNQDHSTATKDNWVVGCTWSFTLLGALLATIFGSASIKTVWSFYTSITEKSFQLSSVLFVWTSNLTEAAEVESALYDEYGASFTCLTAFMGITVTVLELFGRIYDSAIDDVFLLVAITMYKLLDDFKFEVVVRKAIQFHYDVVWKHYRKLQDISEEIDCAFGNIFKLTHFSNLITCGYYLLMLTGPEGNTFDVNFIIFTCTMFKVGMTYLIAVKAARKNKMFRKWIQQMYLAKPYIIVGSTKLKTSVALDELETNPIGLGSDNFHVDETFVMKFIGLVASYFLFLAQSKEKSYV